MGKYDFIATDKPIDRTAAMSIQPGVHFDGFVKNLNSLCQKEPIKVKDYNGAKANNLTGMRKGGLVVIGLYSKRKWVCRCRCGNYIIRNNKTLKNPRQYDAYLCEECKAFEDAKSSQHFKEFGQRLERKIVY